MCCQLVLSVSKQWNKIQIKTKLKSVNVEYYSRCFLNRMDSRQNGGCSACYFIISGNIRP